MYIEERFNYNFPVPIRFGNGVVDELGAYLKNNGLKNPCIVTDKILVNLDFFKNIVATLKKSGFNVSVFNDISKNPIKSNVHKGADFFNQNKCDVVIGLGGGAPMDTARAIVLKSTHPEDLFVYEESCGGDQKIVNDVPHFITIPTTAGTGSEVGRSGIISDDITKKKMIIFSPKLAAKQVFADPMLTMDIPAPVTAATGMDALTHNIEAYVAKGFHPMCEGIALEGIRLIRDSLKTATHKPDIESRSKMLMASTMGAVAFQKGLGVVHSTAHPMSTLFDTHHGLANALMLPYGVKFNMEKCPERYTEIAKIFGTNNLVQYLFDMNKELNLPTKLSEIGIKASSLDELSELAFKDFCHPSNPIPVTVNDFRKIYQEAL